MARFAAGAAALLVVCRADESKWGASPGQYGYDDKQNSIFEFPNPVSVPGHDKCGVNCNRLCQEGLGRGSRDMFFNKNSDCVNSCYAHSIETPHASERWGDTNHQQGKYVQKVMAEYCDRGICGASLAQAAAEVQAHEQKEGAKWSPGAKNWVPDPRAMPSGWPKTCEKQSYYCQEICQNLYHKPASSLGEHFGSTDASWQRDQEQCKRDCSQNFEGMTKYWDEWCTCFKGPGGNMHLENVPGLLQQKEEVKASATLQSTPKVAKEGQQCGMHVECEPGTFCQQSRKMPYPACLRDPNIVREGESCATLSPGKRCEPGTICVDQGKGGYLHSATCQRESSLAQESESVDVGSFMQLSVEL